MRILVLADLEGAAAVVDFERQSYAGGKYHDQAKRMTTREVNALIEGALAGGATEIVVLDAHGPGGLDYELLHPEAQWILGRPAPSVWDLDLEFEVVFLHGHHSMSHTERGVLAHSWSSRTIDNVWLNGRFVGEIGLNIALAGALGKPVVFISGDEAAVNEARQYVPNIEAVVTKKGLSRTCALSLAPAKAQQLIREAAERALRRREEIKPYIVPPPYELMVQLLRPEDAVNRFARADVEIVDERTYCLRSDNLLDLMRRWW
ncbi:MAG TPA: peptidase M55 [Armatimonadetes bacterium]|nr:peptidase M55 [Armatimonadota bacterium]